MIRVRFPNGQAIQYNDANGYQVMESGAIRIVQWVDSKAKWWYAVVPVGATCIVEGGEPCRVENPIIGLTLNKALEVVTSQVREANGDSLEKLKRLLRGFDSRTHTWKA